MGKKAKLAKKKAAIAKYKALRAKAVAAAKKMWKKLHANKVKHAKTLRDTIKAAVKHAFQVVRDPCTTLRMDAKGIVWCKKTKKKVSFNKAVLPLFKMKFVGHGCCRFTGWKAKSKSYMTQGACLALCENDKNCVAADTARPKKKKGTMLHDCFNMMGNKNSLKSLHTKCGTTKKTQSCYAKVIKPKASYASAVSHHFAAKKVSYASAYSQYKAKKIAAAKAAKAKAAAAAIAKKIAAAKAAKAKAAAFRPGLYKIVTTGVHAGDSAAQPAGWGLSAWHAHGAKRNGASSWVAVHSGNHWPMVWDIQPSKRTKGAYTIKTTKYGPADGKQPAGWGLSSWNAHGAKRNKVSSRVAVHSGNHWLMDWTIKPSTRTKGAWTIKTTGVHKSKHAGWGNQPAGWGLSAWQKHGGKRNGASSWVYTHAPDGSHWLMDWKMERVNKDSTYAIRKQLAIAQASLKKHHCAKDTGGTCAF